MASSNRHLILPALVLGLIACKKEQPAAEKAAVEPAAASQAKVGLRAPDNSPEVTAAVRRVLSCEWKPFGFAPSCEAYKAYSTSDLIKRGRADKTMVNLLEDPDDKVRWLAAKTLKLHGKVYASNAELAGRVMTAAEKEKNPKVAAKMVQALAAVDLEETRILDRAIALIKDHPSEEARAELAHGVLFKNRDSSRLYDVLRETAKRAPSAKVRRAAVRGFWIGTPRGRHDEVCELWLDRAQNDASDDVASTAMRLAAQNPSGRCKAHYDALLQLAEKKATAGEVKSADVAFAVKYVHDQQGATDAQKKRALAIAAALLQNEANKDMARGNALRLLGEAHPRGKAIAAKHKDDKSFFVKSAAKRILDGK